MLVTGAGAGGTWGTGKGAAQEVRAAPERQGKAANAFLRTQTSITDTHESLRIPQCYIYEAIRRHDTGQFL